MNQGKLEKLKEINYESDDEAAETRVSIIPTPPKSPLSAFFLFKEQNFDQTRNENPNAKVPEVVSIIAEKWKTISEDQKKKYETLSYESRAKYENDMQTYVKLAKLKPTPPKKPISAFFLFKQQYFDQKRKENPNAKVPEVVSIIAEKWKIISEDEKKKYETLSYESRAKYENDMQTYEMKYGKQKNSQM